MEELITDLRYGVRQLLKSPATSIMAVLSLAIGIGATTAVVSLVNALLLRPLPADDPHRLVRIHSVWEDGTGFHSFSYEDFLSYQEGGSEVLSGLAAEYTTTGSLGAGLDGATIMIDVVSDDFFDVLGIDPYRGRFFLPEETESIGTHPVIVLDHGTWTHKYARDEGILGTELLINGGSYTVIGITPPEFKGTTTPIRYDAYAPMMMLEQINPGTSILHDRASLGLELLGRLAPGVELRQAHTVLEGVTAQLTTAFPEMRKYGGLEVAPATTIPSQVRGFVKAFMAILTAVVGLVLVIACVNVANMLLARALGRRREIAVRIAIGASRARILKQFVAETLILFAVGGAIGIWIATFSTRALLAIELPLPVTIDLDLGIDPGVLGFTLLVTLVAGLLSGLVPALHATSPNLATALKNEDTRAGGPRTRLRSSLVVGQVALSLVLVVIAGLLVRALFRASNLDPGFDSRGVQLVWFDLSIQGYDTPSARRFYGDLQERVGAIPGVESTAVADMVPLALSNQTALVNVEGFDPPAGGRGFVADTMMTSPEYFDTLRIPIVSGRNFVAADSPTSRQVAIVNQEMALRFWPEGNAVGSRFSLAGTGDGPALEVVGVAANSKYRTLGENPRLYFYRPFEQAYLNDAITLHVRSSVDPASLNPMVRDVVNELDPTLPILGITPMDSMIALSLIPQRLAGVLSGSLGVIGLWLAAVGLYGVTAYSVSRRTHEIGIRIALGATAGQVLRLILRQGVVLALGGVGLGLIAAGLSGGALAGFLYGLSPADPLTLGSAAILFLAVAVAASFVPAWRAAHIDPLEALRYE